MAHKFEIYKDKAGEYRVRFKYNSEVMWASEGYSSKASVQNLIDSIKRNGPAALVEDRIREENDLLRRLRSAQVPAADRIVSLNHNSQDFDDFENALKKLEESIRTSNYLGDFSREEIEIAKAEILQIRPENRRLWVRPAHVWQMAKSTLLWIFDHSAGAAIGMVALYALEALAKLLGIAV